MNPSQRLEVTTSAAYFEQLGAVLSALPLQMVNRIGAHLYAAYEDGRSVFLFGNGGSAALASHFACDLGKGTVVPDSDRRFRVMALTDNTSVLTAWGNDFGYEHVFSEPLKNFLRPRDVVIAISCSGNSPNVLRALEVARGREAFIIGLGGFEGGEMKGMCDIALIVPSNNMQIIEDVHLSVTHCLYTMLRHRIELALEKTATARFL